MAPSMLSIPHVRAMIDSLMKGEECNHDVIASSKSISVSSPESSSVMLPILDAIDLKGVMFSLSIVALNIRIALSWTDSVEHAGGLSKVDVNRCSSKYSWQSDR